MGWLIALGILALIAIIPIGVSAFYDADGPRAHVTVGPVRVPVYPASKKQKKEKVKKEKKKKSDSISSGKKVAKKKKGGSLHDFLPIVDLILDFLAAFGRKLRVNRLELKLILAGSDPSDLAVNYGRGWAALGNLMPLLEKTFVIKKRDLEVECDFLAEDTMIVARLDLSITVGRVCSLLIVRGVPVIREFIKLMKTIKGGAKA